MKVSREQAEENRERVLELAGQQFREKGIDGVGVAELMQSAGLTHGAFYGQFASKEKLTVEAVSRAFARSLAGLRERADAVTGGHTFAALSDSYLSTAHRDRPGLGCIVAALGAEAARKGGGLRRAIADGVRAQIALFSDYVRGRTAAARRERAIAAYAAMVGAMVLSRAVGDDALSTEILRSVKDALADVGSAD